MRSLVRSTFIIFGIVAAAFLAQPTVAYATRVTLVRLTPSDLNDLTLAVELTGSLHRSASRVAGWGVNTASVTLDQLILANDCTAAPTPDMDCLVHLTNTPGSGAYGPIIIYGFLRRVDPDHFVVELLLFDTVSGLEPRRVYADITREQIVDSALREQLAHDWLVRLMTGTASSTESVAEEAEPEETASPPPRPGNPHEPFEFAGWNLIGIAGAAFIGAVVSGSLMLGLMGDADYQAYRSTWDADRISNVCDAAASDMSDAGRHVVSVCNDASMHEILVPLFWTVAGLAGATGIVLAWHPWTGSSERPTARLLPTVSPTQAGLNFSLSF